MERIGRRTEQTAVVITVDWELKSLFIAEPPERPHEYEFTTVGELAQLLTGWLIKES